MSPEEKERQVIIQRAKDILSEHFECGEILVQAQDENDSDNTNRYESGWGNRFARDMHIHLMNKERVLEHSWSEEGGDEDDDEDDEDDDKIKAKK
jgi:hypothetical protein